MVKGQLLSGTKMFVVRTTHFVKHTDFAKHLTEYFYLSNETFDKKIKKKQAETILRRGLFFSGLNGEIEDSFLESSFEEGEKFSNSYKMASEWVKKNYPYLT